MTTSTLSNSIPIGNSIVHLLESTNSSSSNETNVPTRRAHQDFHPPLPCLLLPRDSKRILLQGPEKSGRTSLLMDLAYSCAARQSTLCNCTTNPCRCISVVIYRKSPSSSLENDFPMPCRDTRLFENKQGPVKHSTPEWDLDILRRIRIEYVSSSREILQDLLGLLGKPRHDQPFQAILIDDLDQFCQTDSHHDQDGRGRPGSGDNPSIVHMMQTLAVAVDTSHAIHRLHEILPIVLATVSAKTKVVAPWMDTIITLSPCSSSSTFRCTTSTARSEQQSHPSDSRTRWQAEFQGRSSEYMEQPWQTVIDYTITKESEDGFRIEWESRDGHGT